MIKYASDFQEIPEALRNNSSLKDHVLSLVQSKKIAAKATEGGDRLDKFKQILTDLVKDKITLDKAISLTESAIPRHESIHSGSNHVFASGWAERLVRTQFSRFYNQAVLESEVAKGNTECFVPPSSQEQPSSQCSQSLAGRSHDISHLLKLLVSSYEDGQWDKTPKIPDHPHCTASIRRRDHRDDQLKPEIQRVYDENYSVYGIRKVWRQLQREGFSVARCTIARLMKAMGLAGVLRGKKVRTTVSRKDVAASDRVNRQFVAERPNQLWVADFTYVSTWQGFAYVAFIIDVFAGVIVGWRVSSSMETTFVLDALEQAVWARRPSGTIHHSDKGSQ